MYIVLCPWQSEFLTALHDIGIPAEIDLSARSLDRSARRMKMCIVFCDSFIEQKYNVRLTKLVLLLKTKLAHIRDSLTVSELMLSSVSYSMQ